MYESLLAHLRGLKSVNVVENAPLSNYTRFGIGGPADVLIDAFSESSLIAALSAVRASGVPLEVIGEGSNLIVSDAGFRGVVLRFRGSEIEFDGTTRVNAAAGAVLQDLVDETIGFGLAGVHTMTGIPGSVGAAVYGNAGAYGRSISQCIKSVRYYDGAATSVKSNAGCEFHYRESTFKTHKQWVILSAELELERGDARSLASKATCIRKIRDGKYPPAMRCAGSIFKNLILSDLDARVQSRVPARIVKEGKVPAAWFLDESGVKGMHEGGIEVAGYHANLIYNAGGGTAADLCAVIVRCKQRVREHFGGALVLEEEVQYVGFAAAVWMI